MDYLWLQIDNDIVTLGVNETGLEGFDEVSSLDIPDENSEVHADEICGEIETDQGPLNIYSPVNGRIIEVNDAVIQNPDLILEDSYGDGWLFRIETSEPERLSEISEAASDDELHEDNEED